MVDVGHDGIDGLQQLMEMGRTEVFDGVGGAEGKVVDVGRQRQRLVAAQPDVLVEDQRRRRR